MTKNRIPMITHHIDFFFTFRISILFIEKLNCKSGTYNTFRPNSFSNGLMLAFPVFFSRLHSNTSFFPHLPSIQVVEISFQILVKSSLMHKKNTYHAQTLTRMHTSKRIYVYIYFAPSSI